MTLRTINSSPQFYARIAGALYLVIIVLGLFGEMFVRNSMIVAGDAAATSRNILSSPLLWRVSVAGQVLMLLCAVPVALIMYVLLRPVSRHLALLAVYFNLVSMSIEALNNLNLFAATSLFGGGEHLKVMAPQVLQGLGYLALKMHSSGYNISLAFFGVNCLVWGYLIFNSDFFPKSIGVLLMICAGCYVVNSFTWFIAPTFAAVLFPAILVPCFIAELALCLWLLVKGVNVEKWEEHTRERRVRVVSTLA